MKRTLVATYTCPFSATSRYVEVDGETSKELLRVASLLPDTKGKTFRGYELDSIIDETTGAVLVRKGRQVCDIDDYLRTH